ncbi:MAG: DEAD/DEAH box helicase family protein, partial [Victivallaceae bacterium]
MEEAIQLELFDFEDTAPVMELPTLASLQKPQVKVQITPREPEIISRDNYRISPDDVLCPSGAKHKIAANIETIRLLRELEESGKAASDEDCRKLIRYSGWGGVPQVFDPEKTGFSKEYTELKSVLSNEEYASARASTLNSHYTPKFLIEFMWKIAEKTGITQGKFGEFGAGVGHFIGMMPEAFQGHFSAVEIDDISGRIMKQLYPRENIVIKNLQQTFIKRNSLDLVIGNVPFDQVGVHDSDYVGYNLHNYFIARALDALKPGGFAILLTSASTMDSKALNARSNFASRAALAAAVRLPNTAFAEIGTEVVADILVFQKGAQAAEKFLELQSVETADYTGEMRINEYFANHPEMILGTLSNTGNMYGRAGSATVLPFEKPLAESLTVPELTIQTAAQPETDMFGVCDNEPEEIELDEALREYTLFQHDGRIWQCRNHKGVLFTDNNGREFSGKERRKIEHFIDFKERLNLLLQYQLDPNSLDNVIEAQRAKLNRSYDFHVRNFGNLNNRIIHRNLQEDPDYLKLAATENIRKIIETSLDGIKTHRLVHEKGDIYFKRTQHPWREPDHADDIVQAGMISYAYRHRVELDYVAGIMKLSRDDALKQLLASGEFFENPVNGKIELKSEYLSGNVVRKLEIARETAPQNVKALEAVQPLPLRIEDIDFQLGSFWIPPETVQNWLEKTFSIKCQVSYPQSEDKWYVTADYSVRYSMTEYQVADWDLFKLVECALNLKEPIVHRKEWDTERGEEKLVVDQEATLTARQYKNELQDKFRNYVLDTPDTVEELENIYNSIFNSHVTRQYELPAFDIYPGAVGLIDGKKFVLRTHQKRAVSRCIEGNTLLAHCVGAGKTAVMITASMEMKRLRLATKTLIVVQNATLRQFAEFAPKLYPHAMILIADKKDLVKNKRKRFMSRIAVGDWDIVIMAQSSFDMVKDDPDLVMRHYESQLAELEQLIAESDNHSTIKDAERQKKQLLKMLDRLNDKKVEEDIIYFSDLGIDALIIDEAHAYKRNFFPTKMQRVKGLDRGVSQRAFSLSLKIRYIMEKTGGRNIYFATGTPVTNTIAELWNMVRYISPATLEEFGIKTFDRFASVFTGTETALELDAAGRFKMVQRFCKYSNVIELSKMFRTVADVVLSDDLTEVERPPIKGGHPEQVNIRRGEVISQFMNYLCDFYEWYENRSDKRELSHIPLLIYGMSRKVTIDPRLIDHRFKDDPGSKLNVCTRRIHEKYHEYASIKGTQIVFCDLYRNSCDGRELFNAWEELKRKLITAGIPAHEIAIIGDYNTDKQKADLYEKVNSGEILVVIGSTAKLGTGVNIQERLAVAHHLDCPFRPSDVEQRDGRIIRQGNILEEVEIIRYGIEQTLDAGMYAILERKQKFINDAMKGRCARTLQEINDDCALDYASFSAAISGNPKLKRKVVIETRLKELEALERQHRRNTRRRKDQEASLRQRIPAMREEIPELEKFITAYPNLELGSLPIRYGNRELTGTLREKCEVLNRCIRNAYLAAV